MARTTAQHKGHDFLGIYLNDHLAGATGGVGLARRMAAAADPGSESARVLSTVAAEIAQDRAALVKIMGTLGIPVRGYKVLAGWAGEKAGRAKLNGLALHAEPEKFRLLERAERGSGQQVTRNEEFTWFSLGASLPLVSMDAERAARQIVAAVAARRPEVFLTPAAQVVGRLAGLVPELTAPVLHAVQNAVLPDPDGDSAAVAGRELHPTLPGSVFGVLTSVGRRAAVRFNELGHMPGSDGGHRAHGERPHEGLNHEGDDRD